jgi:hypothetical protein
VSAEIDVIEVNVYDGDSRSVIRMTWSQYRAYQSGHFVPRLVPGDDVMLDEDGFAVDIYDVTGQAF